MKKNLLFLLCSFLTLFIISCKDLFTEKNKPVPDTPEIQKNTKKIEFTNNSSFTVDIYYDNNPNINNEIFATVPAKSKRYADLEYIDNGESSTFYIVYNLNFGQKNVSFPYYSDNSDTNHKVVDLTKDYKVTIDEINSCETKSSYLFLENNSSSDAFILVKYTRKTPYGKDDVYIKPGETGVYEVGDNNSGIIREVAGSATVNIDSVNYPLPEITYESGKIYTVTVTNNTEAGATQKFVTSLKAISPFNVDTLKKMWTGDEQTFLSEPVTEENFVRPIMRPAFNRNDGSIIMGVVKKNMTQIGVIKANAYGESDTWTTGITVSSDIGTLQKINVLDCLEQEDGSIVFLLNCIGTDGSQIYLAGLDWSTKSFLWTATPFTRELMFRFDSTNKLISLGYNKFAIVGSEIVYDQQVEEYACRPYISVLDYTTKNNDGSYSLNVQGCHEYYYSEHFFNDSYFCSAYYDGENIFASGFLDCDFTYDSKVHTGIIYKFSTDLSEHEQIYSQKRCLFFSMSGTGKKWYTCGEYWKLADGRLAGCYISSQMISASENPDEEVFPVLYYGDKINSWFSQLCTYDNMIVMCGTASDTQNGEQPLPFVAAYNANGKLIWQNTWPEWSTALNIIPNSIGTYMIQLTDEKNTTIHYVNADFLGNEIEATE